MSDELPAGWTWSTIGEVCTHPQYGWTTRAASDGELHLLRTTDITSGEIDWSSVPFCAEPPRNPEQYLLEHGDIVVSRAGSVGKSYLIRDPERAAFASYLIRFRPKISTEYVAYFLRSGAYWKQISEQTAGIAIPNINGSKLRDVSLPVAPLPEQERIVSKIDELFSRIDEGERALQQVSKLVERYRQSVLKAAVTGELTRDWREARKAAGHPIESGEALLTRILTARREAWEQAELTRMQAKGIKPKDDAWKKKYKEPTSPVTNDLPELPRGWTWASMAQLAWQSSYGTSQKCGYGAAGDAVLRIPNIRSGNFVYDDVKNATTELGLEPGDDLAVGDLLVIRTNGSESLLGTGAVVLEEAPFPCYFASYLIRFRIVLPEELAEWINFCWQSNVVRQFVHANKATSAGQYNISQSSLMLMHLPIPPAGERQMIVDEMVKGFSQIEGVLATASNQTVLREALRQSILKAAFSGDLVDQDAGDEPASILLEYITAKRAETKTAAPKRGRKKKSA